MQTRASFTVAFSALFASLLLASQVQGEASPLLTSSVQSECLATVVSGSDGLVLLPAHCVENGNSNEVVIQNWSLNVFTRIPIQRTKIHPSYRPGEAAFDFALGFADPVTVNAIGPMLLLDTLSSILTPARLAKTEDLAVYSIRQAETGQNEPKLTSGKLAYVSGGACGAEPTGGSSSSVVGCFVGKWSSKAECEDNFSGHQFIGLTLHTKLFGDKLYLYGFASRDSRCSDAGDQVSAVGHFKNALEFINSELERLHNVDYSGSGSEASGGGDSSASGTSSPVPTSSSPNTASASPVPTSSSSAPGGEANGGRPPAPGSSIIAPDLLPPSVQGECLGVRVDERVLLFPAHCAENLGKQGKSNEVAIFGETASYVKKVQIQRTAIHPLYRPGETAFDFALGFAGWDAEFVGTWLRLDTSLYYQSESEHPKPKDLYVYSIRQAATDQNKLTVTRGKIAFASSGACGTETTSADSSVVCFIGTWSNKAECEDNFSGHQIIVQTMHPESKFLSDTDYLSGFASRSSRCSEAGEQVFAVNHFENALGFIEDEVQLLDSGFDSTPGDSDSWSIAPTVLPQSDRGQCLGVMVSDSNSLVLLPAHCAVNLGKHGNSNEVALRDRNTGGATKVPIQRFKIHPLYRSGETAFDFALGVADPEVLSLVWSELRTDRFSEFQSQVEHPKLEDLSVYSVRRADTEGNDLAFTVGKVVFASSSVCGADSSVGCLIGTWSDYTECDDNFSGHQMIVQTMHYDGGFGEVEYLSGFVSRSSRCSRTGYQVLAFTRFGNAREFIESELEQYDFSGYDLVVASDSSGGDSSASGSSSPATPAPTDSSPVPASPALTSTSPSSVPGSGASGSSSSPGGSIVAPTLLPQSDHGECIGAVVDYSKGLVLLPAHCADNLGKHDNSNKVVIQGFTLSDFNRVPIQRTKIHPLYRTGETAFDFALGLVHTIPMYSLLRLATTSYFDSQVEHPKTEKMFVYNIRQAATDRNESEVQTLTRAKVAFPTSDACGAQEVGSSANSSACFIGKWKNKAECEDHFSGHQIIVQAMDVGGGYSSDTFLSGFITRSSRCSETGDQVFTVNRFKNALEFINSELANLDPSSYDPVPADPSEYEKQLVTFYDGLAPLNCSGAIIAPRFLLTTATCVSSHSIAHVAFGKTGVPQLIQSNRTVLHPQFTSGYSRFDAALLELESPLSKTPISLSSEADLVGGKLGRVSQEGVDQVVIDELSKCPSTDLSLAPGGAGSGALVCVNQTLPGSGSGPLGGDSILIQESQGKLLLTGIELAAKNCVEGSHECYSGIYISISSLANFIDAFASGQLWDFQEPTPTPSPTPAPSPLPTKPCVGHGCDSSVEPTPLPIIRPPAPAPAPVPVPAPVYPYIVGLRAEKEGRNFCGGALIDSFHVLTAAHCVEDRIVKWVSVGSPTSSKSPPQNLPVERITTHPQYKSKAMLNDVAVLQLRYYADSPKFPDMDTASDHPDQTAATMLSFGTTSSNTLKGVGVPIWARKICEAKYPNADFSIVCAGGVAGIDACAGDSGSPLIVKDAGGNDVVVGLVSSGFECGQSGMPGFYTRVSTVREFIKEYAIITDQNETPHDNTQRPSSAPLASPPSSATDSVLPSRPVTSTPPTSSIVEPSGAGFKGTTNSPRTDGSVKTDSLSRTPSPTSSSDAPITAVKLDDNLPTATQQKVADFFTGTSSLVPSDLLAKLMDPGNQIVLYSTGDTQGSVAATSSKPSNAPGASATSPGNTSGTAAPSSTRTVAPPETEPPSAGSTLSPRTGDSSKNDSTKVPAPAPAPTLASSQISYVPLDKDLPPAAKQKVLNIIVAKDAYPSVSCAIMTKLVNPENQVMLYSTADLQPLVEVIDRNSKKH